MKIENILERFSCISFLFKPPWSKKPHSLILKVPNLPISAANQDC